MTDNSRCLTKSGRMTPEPGERNRDGTSVDAIRSYVHEVLPKARLLHANGLWSISCMPTTNGGHRTFTMSCPGLEALFGYLNEDGDHVMRMCLLQEELPMHVVDDLSARHELDQRAFEFAGYKTTEVVLLTIPALPMAELLTDPLLLRAARGFALTRFSEGGNPYTSAQSWPLASMILQP